MSARVVGIDVGARELDCAALDGDGRVTTAIVPAADLDALARWCMDAVAIGIDAPEAPSTEPHRNDRSLAPKFRAARCAEIELGRRHGSWVSWVAPAAPPFPGWIATGLSVFAALRPLGATLLEVYPYAGFRRLAGGRRPARKQTRAGAGERVELLTALGVSPDGLADRTHHALDAVMVALVARDHSRGTAERVTCGHDDSAIWLPAVAG